MICDEVVLRRPMLILVKKVIAKKYVQDMYEYSRINIVVIHEDLTK